jgi:hypothetical protein
MSVTSVTSVRSHDFNGINWKIVGTLHSALIDSNSSAMGESGESDSVRYRATAQSIDRSAELQETSLYIVLLNLKWLSILIH